MIPNSYFQRDLWEFIRYSLLHDPDSLFTYCRQRTHLSLHRVEANTLCIRNIGAVNFPLDFQYGQQMKWMYWGIYQFPIQQLMRKILKPGDICIDAGANVGYFSAIAMDIVGRSGEVHSFEPIPEYFAYLTKVKELNPVFHHFICNMALGDWPGMLTMAINSENVGGSTPVYRLLEHYIIRDWIEVPVMRLDTYLEEHVNGRVGLVKIDVEGFEYPVLKGMQSYLDTAPVLPPIICEIVPKAYPILHTSLSELAAYMGGYDYDTRLVSNPSKTIDVSDLRKTTDVLFLPSR